MSSNTDIIQLLSTEADKAIDQIIVDAARLHTVVNGTGTDQATTEDGSLIPSVRKALLDNFYFKVPVLPWRNGQSVTVFNQLYSFTDEDGVISWWYAPGATTSSPAIMTDSPYNNVKFKIFMDRTDFEKIYAKINSPQFTGNPRAPTPNKDDSSNSIATSAFVQDKVAELNQKIKDVVAKPIDKIVVLDSVTTKDLFVTGKLEFSGPILEASNSEGRFKKITMVGPAAEIAFSSDGAKTNIKPDTITTEKLNTDQITAKTIQVGSIAPGTVNLNVDGDMTGDYLRLSGNSANPASRPQLIVDGIAEIKTLRVTDPIEGLKADVDGLDIKPRSVVADRSVSVGTTLTVVGDTTLGGTTKVKDLNITGTVTGLDLNVDNLDIKPRSVTTTQGITVGQDLNVSGRIVGQSADLATLQATTSVTTVNLNASGVVAAEKIESPSIEADKILVVPAVISAADANYYPDGKRSLYDITVVTDTIINPPVGLLTDGLGGTIILYVTQDAAGGHNVSFSTEFLVIGDGEFDTSPNATTIVQLMYRGSGSVIDTIVSSRR